MLIVVRMHQSISIPHQDVNSDVLPGTYTPPQRRLAIPYAADEILARVDEAWRPLRTAVDDLGADRLREATAAGWSAREMLAHVAFWDEAAVPVITYMLRGREIPEGWRFASGYVADRDQWPSADHHNAREAAWARAQTPETVIERLDAAHRAFLETVQSVADAEVAEHTEYFESLGAHYVEHLPELRALLDGAR